MNLPPFLCLLHLPPSFFSTPMSIYLPSPLFLYPSSSCVNLRALFPNPAFPLRFLPSPPLSHLPLSCLFPLFFVPSLPSHSLLHNYPLSHLLLSYLFPLFFVLSLPSHSLLQNYPLFLADTFLGPCIIPPSLPYLRPPLPSLRLSRQVRTRRLPHAS